MLILNVLLAGERLVLEKAHPRYLRPGRPISVSAVPLGPGTDIWRSCRALFGALRALPGGIGRFIPCDVGANHRRLRHIRWEKCGHGFTSRPRESASEAFLDEMLQLFQYPPLLGLPMRCLLENFPFCTALLGLLVRSLLGGCQFLDMLLAWLLLVFGLLMVVRQRLLVRRFTGLVVLDQVGKEFD